jgi:hypothetical protein
MAGMVSLGLYGVWMVDSDLPVNFGSLESRCGLTTHHTYILYINVHEMYCVQDGFPRLILYVNCGFQPSREFWRLRI